LVVTIYKLYYIGKKRYFYGGKGMFKRLLITVISSLLIGVSAYGEESFGVDLLWGATVPSVFSIYIMNPDRLAGWHGPLYGYEKEFIPEKYQNLPLLGAWHGGGGLPDKEMLIKNKIKDALVIPHGNFDADGMTKPLEELGLKVHVIRGGALAEYIPVFRELGKLLKVPDRGEELAQYAENALKIARESVKDVPEDKKPLVLLAGGKDGLTTSCNVPAIEAAGGVNAFKCLGITLNMPRLSFEEIVIMNPDVILFQDPSFIHGKSIIDSNWKRLRAYKEKRMFVVPYGPFGWLEKPEAVKFMAVQWLTCKLYADRCPVDIAAETKRFMKLFFNLDLDDEKIKVILREGLI
jgi:iron complex transport system substrate-binding protein